MKRLLMSLMMLAAIGVFANEKNQSKLEIARDMYIQGVKNGNIGLRCDAIFRIAEMKSTFPQIEMKACMAILNTSIRNDSNPLVRTWAGLTLAYLTEKSLSHEIKVLPEETSIEFFQRLQWAMYDQVFVMNQN